jgi:hypothetical protein
VGFLDKLFGGAEPPAATRPAPGAAPLSADERAIAQYRYMLQTAPPQAIEQAHAEAFAKLSPEQRTMVLQQLTNEAPEAERPAAGTPPADDPASLARMATRAEVRQPGTMERLFGGAGGRGMGMGGLMAGSFLSTIAGVVVGSAIAQAFLGDGAAHHGDAAAADAPATDTASAEADHGGGDLGGDLGGDFGGDFG